jgi:hypothetical protein
LFAGESPPPKKARVDKEHVKPAVEVQEKPDEFKEFPLLLSPGENKCNPQGVEEELSARNLTDFRNHVENLFAT